MRLDKLLVHTGYGSRKEVQKLIKSKKVTVDGEVAKKIDMNVDPKAQVIKAIGEIVDYQPFYYYILNKPGGYITATEDAREATVLDLLDSKDRNREVFPVGRLDKDTEGLLLLTNDGKMAHALLSPKKHVDKVYFAKVQGAMVPEDCEAFAKGITLKDGTSYQPGKLEILSSGEFSEVLVTIKEGKFHQVKRMVQAVGKEVVFLKRIKMGALDLPEDLATGAYRQINEDEKECLKAYMTE